MTRQLYVTFLLLAVSLALAGCTPGGSGYFSSPIAPAGTDGVSQPAVTGTPGSTGLAAPASAPVASRTSIARSSDPGWTAYTSINQVNDVAFAPGGVDGADRLWASIWVEGSGGLVRWDLETETYTWYDVDARQIAIAPDGTLWVISGKGVCHFDGEDCQTYGQAQGLQASEAGAIAVAPDGSVWLGSEAGISRFDGHGWQSMPAGGRVEDLALADDGQVWAATGRGVARYDPNQGRWTRYGQEQGLPEGQALRVAVGPQGEVWSYILWEGVYYLDGDGGGKTWTRAEEVCPGLITDLAVAGDGTPWIAAGGGTHYPGGCLAYRDGGAWFDLAAEYGLVSVGAVALGPAGEVAASTSLGLGIYRDGAWRLLKDGPTQPGVRAVAITPDGAAWFGFGDSSVSTTGGGLSRFDGQRWDYFLDDGEVGALAVAPDGRLWAGVGCSVLRRNGNAWETVAGCEDLSPGNVLDIAFTADGAAWVSSGFGLGRFDGTYWTLYDRMASFLVAAPARAGKASGLWLNGWAGAENSGYVAHFDGREWTEYRLADSFPGSFVLSAVTPGGQVCGRAAERGLACFDGVSWSSGSSWTFYDSAREISLERASLPVVAPDGAAGAGGLWLSTEEGPAHLDGAGTPEAAWTIYRADEALGLPSGGAIAFGPAGEVWVGATRLQPPVAAAPPTTSAGQTPAPTPVAPLQGMVYRAGDALWTDVGPQRMRLLDDTAAMEPSEARISPDGTRILYLAGQGGDQDVWLADLVTGERRNLTRTPDRIESDPRWWPAHPGLVVLSSAPRESEVAPETGGYLTTVGSDGSGYRVLDERVQTGGPPAPSPAGNAIAYGRGRSGWIYQLGTDRLWPGQMDPGRARAQATGEAMMPDDKQRRPPPVVGQPKPFDPAKHGLAGGGAMEIGNPAWSPEGRRLAWIVGGDLAGDGSFRWVVAMFDLESLRATVLQSYEGDGTRAWPPPPVWSPDGAWLAFVARADRASETGVWVVPAGGQGEGARHLGGDHPVWSPDGRLLALSGMGPGDTEVWLATAGTWSLQRLDLPPGAYVVDWIEATPGRERVQIQSPVDAATPAPASQATATGEPSLTSGPTGALATARATPALAPPRATPLPSPATPVVWSHLQVLGPENVAQMAQAGVLGRGSARDLAWSPGGHSLAVATSQGIDLYDVETASWGASLPTQAGVLSLAWDPGGELLAAGLADGTARIWEAGSGTLLHSLWGHGQAVPHVVLTPDGRWLISGGGDGTLRVWDTATGREVRRLAVQSLHQVLLSPDGRWNATGGGKWQRQVQVWDLATGEMAHELEISPDLLSMAFSPDGKTLAVVESWEQSPPVLLLDLESGQVRRLDYTGAVRSIAWSPDGAVLATGGAGLRVRLWDAATGELAGTVATGEEWPSELAFSPEGTRLAASGETEVRVWDLVRGQIVQVLPSHGTRDLAFDPGGGWLAWRAGNAVRLLDLASGEVHDPPGHAGPIASLAFGAGGRLLAVGDWDGSIQLWQWSEGQIPVPGQAVRRIVGHAGPVGALAFSPDGQTLASGGMNEDQQIRLWDAGTGQVMAELAGDANYPAGSLVFTPDGGTLAGGGARQVILWDLASGQTRRLDGHEEGILSLAISPDGQRLASGSFDTMVIVWDMASGRNLHTLPGHTLGAASLAFSPDGALLASGDQGGAARVWEAARGQLLQTIQGRGSDLAFSPNGELLAFKGSLDDIVLWDVIRGRELRRLPGHRPLAFSPNGQVLVVGTREGTVEVWGVSR